MSRNFAYLEKFYKTINLYMYWYNGLLTLTVSFKFLYFDIEHS